MFIKEVWKFEIIQNLIIVEIRLDTIIIENSKRITDFPIYTGSSKIHDLKITTQARIEEYLKFKENASMIFKLNLQKKIKSIIQ